VFRRFLDLGRLLAQRSLFLFGPRQTGKSTLVRATFPDARYFDLLEADTFRELSARPEYMRQTLPENARVVVIDEVQKLPPLLDEVHLLIERNKRLRFVLTGSSARKLKRGGANLLAGRARIARLHPLAVCELPAGRHMDRINRGGLPSILDSAEYQADLRDYVGTYLKEEIQAEGLTRSIGNFSRFLEVAGLTNGEQINFTSVASDVGLSPNTVREYYQILEDTLVGHLLPPFQGTAKRKPVATSKFYLFDVGVANSLRRAGFIERGSDTYGRALEHLVFLELRTYLDYTRSDEPLTFWRSLTKFEVDFLIHDRVAIEVKGKSRVLPRNYRGILALGEELGLERRIVVCEEAHRRRDDRGVEILPVETFFRDLWEGKIV